MNYIHQIINGLNSQEYRELKYFIARNDKVYKQRKDLLLLDLIRKNPELTNENLSIVLYNKSTNAFNVLKNNLKENLEQFLLFTHVKEGKFEAIKSLVVADFLFKKRILNPGWKYLKNAEKIGLKTNLPQIKQFIHFEKMYRTTREFSYTDFDYDKLKSEKDKSEKEINTKSNILLKNIELRKYFNQLKFKNKDGIKHINLKLLFKDVDYYHTKKDIDNLIEIFILIKNNCFELNIHHILGEKLLSEVKNKINPKIEYSTLNQSSLSNLFQGCAIIANSLKKYSLSKQFAENFIKFSNLVHGYRLFHHIVYTEIESTWLVNSGEINTAIVNYNKALSLIKKGHNKEKLDISFLYYQLADLYFMNGNFENALDNFVNIFPLPSIFILNLGQHGLLRASILECIIHYENNNIELVLYKINAIKRKYKKLLLKKDHIAEYGFIKLLAKIVRNNNILKNDSFIIKTNNYIEEFNTQNIDLLFMPMWLNNKIIGESMYAYFLQYVKGEKK